jgi:iduronate 2-sulfatase
VDFMSIFPTLCDLCGLPTPAHVQGKSIASLLRDPAASWDQPAVTTYKFMNHTVRSEGWRLIRYANGDQELYNETNDPNEWTNLAKNADASALEKIGELAKYLPTTNHADIGGEVGKGAEDFGDGKKAEKKRLRQQAAKEAAEAQPSAGAKPN